MADKKGLTRRRFLANSTRGAAAVGMGSVLVSQSAASAARVFGANDRITLGLIGSGGQGTNDTRVALTGDKNIVCRAICDLAEFRLERASRILEFTMSQQGHKGIEIDRHWDYRELLDRKGIDAVVLATPDHWHAGPFIAACEAEKHIYQEKPFCFTIELGQKMLAAAQKKPELIIQIGTQRRSRSNYKPAKKFIDEDGLGKIGYIRAFDCRNYITGRDPFAPKNVGPDVDWEKAKIDWDTFQEPCEHKVEFDPWRYTAWRWFWDYANGLITDVGVHVIDNVHMLLGEPTPKSAVCNGGVYGLDYWETPDVVNAVVDYGDFSLSFTSNFTNGFEGDGYILYGTKGTMEVRGNDVKVWPEGKREKPLHHWPSEGVAHQHNWVHCLRSGDKVNAPVELGMSSLLPSLMGNMAYRKGCKVAWDPAAKKAKCL